MTTITTFITALAGLTVSGVTTKYTGFPDKVTTSDLPCTVAMYPSFSQNEDAGPAGADCWTWGFQQVAQYYVVSHELTQGETDTQRTQILTLADAAVTALRAAIADSTLGADVTFNGEVGSVPIGTKEYRAVRFTVTSTG